MTRLALASAVPILLAILMSYGMATLGEPQSVWFWTIIGVL